ncbi:MAG: glycosyltransferase [Chloroflexota bacterium]
MDSFISVIIPALNAGRVIDRCLTALSHQTLDRAQYELLVVDDGSRDDTAERAKAQGARVVRLSVTLGPGGARNAGISAARGEIIVFTDADCEPTASFLESLVTPLSDPRVGGTKGVYLSRQQELVARFVQLEYEDRYRHTAMTRWIDFVDTYAACFWKRDLERVGGFDPMFRQCGDQELSFRLADAGVHIRFVPEARTFHLHANRLSSYLKKKFGIGWWKVAVLSRHPGKAVRDSHTPQMMKLELAAAVSLAGSVLAAGPLALMGSGALGISLLLGTLALFLACTAPFLTRAIWKDWKVGLVSPAVLLARDLALVSGLLLGIKQAPREAAQKQTSWLDSVSKSDPSLVR